MSEPRIERTDTSVHVTAVLAAPAAALFAVLTDPRRHAEIDGSGMVQAAAGTAPITAAGESFTMQMRYPSLGDYRTVNLVSSFERDRTIAWQTAREGQPPAGVVWRWTFEPVDDTHTRVEHTYDWSGVTDPAVLARVSFPRVAPEQLVDTVRALESACRG